MQIAPGIYSLGQRKGAHVHAFLLDDGNELTLIDTLFDKDAHIILEQIKQIGKNPANDLKHIIMTHAHRSHLGGIALLKELTGAPVYAHEWEADLIAGERRTQCVTWRPRSPLRSYPFQVAQNLQITNHPPATVDHYIHDGDKVGPLEVLYSPGHSPGHLAFYWPERKALFTGDAVVTWPRFELGWRGFLLNVKQHKESVYRLAELDAEILGVGHGESVTGGGSAQIRAALPQLERLT